MTPEINELHKELPGVEFGVSLAPLTTFRVGGPAEALVTVRNAEEMQHAVEVSRRNHIPFVILGGGSNVLVSDVGVPGLVIRTMGGRAVWSDNAVTADAGVILSTLIKEAASRSLAGMEYAVGVPGTVGGAIRGNAGTRDGETKDVIQSVRAMDPSGKVQDLSLSECHFEYRSSQFKKEGWVVLQGIFTLHPEDPKKIQEHLQRNQEYKKTTQRVGASCAGCAFMNVPLTPEQEEEFQKQGFGYAIQAHHIGAGFLIDQAGLKGIRQGDAQVSLVHGNFILNHGAATAQDLRTLMDRLKKGVFERFGLTLKEEVQVLGWES